MNDQKPAKIIIVEGLTDKAQIKPIINETVLIICTHGTLGVEEMDELLDIHDLYNAEVYILVDEDYAGRKLRRQLTSELPRAEHIYVSEEFREVANTPRNILAAELVAKHIQVHMVYLKE